MRIGVLAGEIPPPFFIHQLLYTMAEKDYEVIICGRREIRSKDLNSIRVNVKSDESVKELFEKVRHNFGDINGLVFSAGITTPKKSIEDFNEKTYHDVFDTNVTG